VHQAHHHDPDRQPLELPAALEPVEPAPVEQERLHAVLPR
jgi:hypothetical protein